MSEEKIDPLKLKPYKKNSKKHSERQVQRIANSIKEFGFTKPVLVWGKNQIVAGHGAVEAAISLGLAEIPIRRVDHLSEQQMRAYVIADNKLAEESKWDMGVLHEELTDLARLDFDLEFTGFSLDAVADMILENGLKEHARESEEIRREVLGEDIYDTETRREDEARDSDEIQPPTENKGHFENLEPVIKYDIVFDNIDQQDAWYEFIKTLKKKYPDAETMASRIIAWLNSEEVAQAWKVSE